MSTPLDVPGLDPSSLLRVSCLLFHLILDLLLRLH